MIDKKSKNLRIEFLFELFQLRTLIKDAGYFSKQRLDVTLWTDSAIDIVSDLIECLPLLKEPIENNPS